MSAENNLVKAIYSFKGKNNDELCFKKGDIITVTQREEGGWWEGTLGETTGWFPSNYVTEHKDASGSSATSPVRAPSEIQAFRNVVLKDIIDSERAHVAEMQALITNFLEPLERSDILTKDEYKQLTSNITEVAACHEQLLALVEECGARSGPDQRVGGVFLQWAPRLQAVHHAYCAAHPKAVCILDKFKEELNEVMELWGAARPGVLVLCAGLSKPFRRLGKYPAMLAELGRHVHEAHPDRGDTHRAATVYKEMATAMAALRRQKELELQVVTGEVRGWAGGAGGAAALGEVLHMGGVALHPRRLDRYLVLFPSALLLLSVSKRVSAFVYEGCLPLTGITVTKLDDSEGLKNAFEISGAMIEPIVAVCQTRAEADNWVSLLQRHAGAAGPAQAQPACSAAHASPTQPHSLPHLTRSPSEGALSSIRSTRRSIYHVTLPPSNYPAASPYHSLTKYFANLVQKKVITRAMLRKLLYERSWIKAFQFTEPVMRRHKNIIRLRVGVEGRIESETECGDSEDESDESNTESETQVSSSSSCADSVSDSNRMWRQNALDYTSDRSASTSSSSSHFGYMRYYNNNSSDSHLEMPLHAVRGDCTKEIFESLSHSGSLKKIVNESPEKQASCNPYLSVDNPLSNTSGSSSFDTGNPHAYMACEDLPNMDQDMVIDNRGQYKSIDSSFELNRQSCPHYRSNKIPQMKPAWKSAEETHVKSEERLVERDSSIPIDLIQALDPPQGNTFTALSDEERIIDPPPMFKTENDVKVVIVNPHIPFRKHSINSDKKLRRSVTKSMIDFGRDDKVNIRERMSCQSDQSKAAKKHCECCNASTCQSPRSSDSGVAGSCNLASPDLTNLPDPNDIQSSAQKSYNTMNHCMKELSEKVINTNTREKLTLSDIEAANFEEQCRCTSPFDSTPRTSCQPSLTSENVVIGGSDSARTSVTSTYLENNPVSSSQTSATKKIERTSFKANINQHITIPLKRSEKPRIPRKPSVHSEVPKNVRRPPIRPGWSTLNITERTKPSRHYHMRIYRDETEGEHVSKSRVSRKDACLERVDKACQVESEVLKKRPNAARSRSVDSSKILQGANEQATGFVVYRSDLYAHWWMKAKLPITVVNDAGKDSSL